MNLKKKLDSKKAYNILDSTEASGSTWTQGGCAILAFALNKLYEYPVYVIYNKDRKQVEHFVVKTEDDYYLDYDGKAKEKKKLTDFVNNELIDDELVILPYNKNLNISDIVIDDNASENLSLLLKNIKESFSEFYLNNI
jgi:hypothetical protein